jgi:hypothetical protein
MVRSEESASSPVLLANGTHPGVCRAHRSAASASTMSEDLSDGGDRGDGVRVGSAQPNGLELTLPSFFLALAQISKSPILLRGAEVDSQNQGAEVDSQNQGVDREGNGDGRSFNLRAHRLIRSTRTSSPCRRWYALGLNVRPSPFFHNEFGWISIWLGMDPNLSSQPDPGPPIRIGPNQ